MPLFMATGGYTPEGVEGLLKTGGARRAEQLNAVAESLGGRLVALYFGMSENDTFIVLDLPDSVAALGLSKNVNAANTGHCNMERIFTPEEVDEAIAHNVQFLAPGT
jgi:uncharacterized protein with GYD domain